MADRPPSIPLPLRLPPSLPNNHILPFPLIGSNQSFDNMGMPKMLTPLNVRFPLTITKNLNVFNSLPEPTPTLPTIKSSTHCNEPNQIRSEKATKKCKVCGKTYTRLARLRIHERTHVFKFLAK